MAKMTYEALWSTIPVNYTLTTESEMNCIAGLRRQENRCASRQPSLRPTLFASRLLSLLGMLALYACGVPASENDDITAPPTPARPLQIAQTPVSAADEEPIYSIEYVITPNPGTATVSVEMHLQQDTNLLREVDMRAPDTQFGNFSGDGEIIRDGERLIWRPPGRSGTLRWIAKINHQRNTESYDAYMTPNWAIFRAEDIIPRAASRSIRGAKSDSSLSFRLPRNWSAVTEYFGRGNNIKVRNSNRRFDRPAGWMLLGEIGVRYEKIAGVRVNVAAPVGQGMRRMDVMALLAWSLPEIVRIFPDFPDRLTIIGASDPMWRGGLSGPRSLFIHTDRPLLSENATSTLLHEIVHIGLGRGAESGADWIVEGLAEYFGLMILRRSGTISERRHIASLKEIGAWGQQSEFLCTGRSSGASTAKAVTVFAELDAEIQRKSHGINSLDDVIRALAQSDLDITIHSLKALSVQYLDSDAEALSPDNLPGCGR